MVWTSSRPDNTGWGKGHFLSYISGYGFAVGCNWCGATERTAENCPHDSTNCSAKGHANCHRETALARRIKVKE